MRKIIHIDMDAFYASVEQRDNAELRGRPIAVGGKRNRGVVAAASYEARKFGVFSAMPSKLAIRKCPDLIFVKPRFEVYKAVSQEIRAIFYRFTDLVEPLSLDEAFLDVTENKIAMPSATIIAQRIKKQIREELHLVASAGISVNKFLAKTASDMDKPDGLFVIEPQKAQEFIEQLPIEKFFGVGKVTAKKMHQRGIYYGSDLKKNELSQLIRWFGKQGHFFYNIARGIDERPVVPHRQRKSVGAERTFETDLQTNEQLEAALHEIVEILYQRYVKSGKSGRTLSLKIKYSDFQIHSKSKTTELTIQTLDELDSMAMELLKNAGLAPMGIRLLGLSVSNLDELVTGTDYVQLLIPFVY